MAIYTTRQEEKTVYKEGYNPSSSKPCNDKSENNKWMHTENQPSVRARELIKKAEVYLGIELGSTRIKACLISPQAQVLATGGFEWENRLVDGHWSYDLELVWTGIAAAYADLKKQVKNQYDAELENLSGLGISAMMHGYLAFDANDNLLVPFRTWRDTYTTQAAHELSEAINVNIPLRWSISHFYQAVLAKEPHASQVEFITTLSGYVHWKLTGQKVIGVGDASGMFPIDSSTKDYHAQKMHICQKLIKKHGITQELSTILPKVLCAGENAGYLSQEGAKLLDPTGKLKAGVPICPPEGDAGTGMVATNAVRPRTGNVSAGTSIFAMIVLEKDLEGLHPEIDPVTTPAGDAVAMVHCNNGASEIATWVEIFSQAITRGCEEAGVSDIPTKDHIYKALFQAALQGDLNGGGLVFYNYLSGEPLTNLSAGRPLIVRTPESQMSLANFMRVQIYSAYATLALGMRIINLQGVKVDKIFGHGGIFKTPGVAQRILAAALDIPVGIADSAGEGGAWGIAVISSYSGLNNQAGNANKNKISDLDNVDNTKNSSSDTQLSLDASQTEIKQIERRNPLNLADYLDQIIFADQAVVMETATKSEVAGFAEYLEKYEAGLPVEKRAVELL